MVFFLKSSYFSVLPEEPAAPDGVPGLFNPLLVHGIAGFHVFGLHVPQVDLPLKASRHQLVPHDVGTVEGQAATPQVWSTISTLFCYLFTIKGHCKKKCLAIESFKVCVNCF